LLTLLGNIMGIAERRQRHKEEIKKEIILTAWELVKKEGWQSLSIRKIADAIEYSVPVIYDHFENKEAILLEFAKKGYYKLFKHMFEAKEQHTDPAEQIKAMADAYWNFAHEHRELYQLMFGIGMACCEIDKAVLEKEQFRAIFTEPIEQLVKKSERTDINVCLKYHALWSLLHGLISIRIVGNTPLREGLDKMILDDAIQGYLKNLS